MKKCFKIIELLLFSACVSMFLTYRLSGTLTMDEAGYFVLFLVFFSGALTLALVTEKRCSSICTTYKALTAIAAAILLFAFFRFVLPNEKLREVTLVAQTTPHDSSGEVWLVGVVTADGESGEVSLFPDASTEGWIYKSDYDDFVFYPREAAGENFLTLTVPDEVSSLSFGSNPWSGGVTVVQNENKQLVNLKSADQKKVTVQLEAPKNRQLYRAVSCMGAFLLTYILLINLVLTISWIYSRLSGRSRPMLLMRITAFATVLVLLLSLVSRVLGKSNHYFGYQLIQGFYEEKPNTLDAVYIGASNVFMFWEAPLAWKHYGITVWPFASDALNICVAEDLVREARKTQPDALYIVGLNNIHGGGSGDSAMPWIHELTDILPRNANRSHMIKCWTEYAKLAPWEYYFPIVRFHSRWNSLTENDFRFVSNGLKSGTMNFHVEDIADEYQTTEIREKLEESTKSVLNSLINYCDENEVKMLFIIAPRADGQTFLGQMNSAIDLIQERGYPVLNMQKLADEYYLDPSTDYYNGGHVNTHGAVKTTDYLARYLIENYGFQDKRGDYHYADWGKAYQKYAMEIAPYVLPFEYEDTKWDFSLDAPYISEPDSRKGTIVWNEIEGADGYGIFKKKSIYDAWTLCETVDAGTLQWTDQDYKKGTTYTVVAYTQQEKDIFWGKYDIASIAPS